MKSSLVAINAIDVSYGQRSVFRGFAFEQRKGEHQLLLGPSGSGKTTLINLVTGLLTPDRGEVLIDGEPMSAMPGSKRDDLRRRKIGVIFQTLRLVSALSVRGNLRLAQRLAGQALDDTAIDGMIEAIGIAYRADARPHELSQGEAQRAAIARALTGRPKLVVADEPTSALDDANAKRIARVLIEMADANGATMLIATHDTRLKAFIGRSRELAPLAEAA